jgi:hypothetical protein
VHFFFGYCSWSDVFGWTNQRIGDELDTWRVPASVRSMERLRPRLLDQTPPKEYSQWNGNRISEALPSGSRRYPRAQTKVRGITQLGTSSTGLT